ncbi:MAG: tRNA (adenosine(37)-N6)-threonylcarbamoyltransferase complex transferase subunit TsaD [Nanoarchaeota archaeon]|nr:tRNA (adenosine(37)-N6)-threonylcarbamoyltransferase complex transferase subunit TsaD [Nanoarchaeota archaeon]MCG2700509.1 tRNA (adenosine(37)-N6)-threonylcarbamoyltransferase complex transferase subunit TsaD [Candidatus Parcubacteria bacterium]
MVIGLGIECTAHTLGIGIVKDGKIIINEKNSYVTEEGGIIPIDAAKHHEKVFDEVLKKVMGKTKLNLEHFDFISVSIGPGLAPCLLVGLKKAKQLCKKFKLFLVPVNHCIAHLEIGNCRSAYTLRAQDPKLWNAGATGAKNPVMLYVSGANTQIIAYEEGKYRVFGETLDIGVGNFIDNFARYAGIGFPGGPKIQKLAKAGTPQAYTQRAQDPEKSSTKIFTGGKKYIELPYKVKGMDIALSGILTNLKQKLEKNDAQGRTPKNIQKNIFTKGKYSLNDLAYSMQETVFAMLVETAERALAHVGKKELLLGGGVACNSRLQEMCRIMCKERGAKLFVPENEFLTDNGAMIAFLGEIMFNSGINFSYKELDKIDIKPRQRTDDVGVSWK